MVLFSSAGAANITVLTTRDDRVMVRLTSAVFLPQSNGAAAASTAAFAASTPRAFCAVIATRVRGDRSVGECPVEKAPRVRLEVAV